jgi:hypothetical protein
MQTRKSDYIKVVTQLNSSKTGHAILAQALDACAMGVLAEESPDEVRRRLMEGAVNLASAFGLVAAYRIALVSQAGNFFRVTFVA